MKKGLDPGCDAGDAHVALYAQAGIVPQVPAALRSHQGWKSNFVQLKTLSPEAKQYWAEWLQDKAARYGLEHLDEDGLPISYAEPVDG